MMSGKDFVKATCILHLTIDVKAVNKTHNIKERKDKPEKNKNSATVCVDVTGNHRRIPGSGKVVTSIVRSTHIIYSVDNNQCTSMPAIKLSLYYH